MKKSDFRSDCPINFAIEQLGDKWTMLVLRDLIFEGNTTFKQFLESKEKIATNMLSDRLKKLELGGFISSRRNEKQKTQKVYSLTPKSVDLIPTFIEILIWSHKHGEGLALPDEFVEKLQKDKTKMTHAIINAIGTNTFSANRDS